jgi:hypothetical protein
MAMNDRIVRGLDRIPRPDVPLTRPWEVSLGQLLPGMPGFVGTWLRRLLNRAGHLRLDPDGLTTNGTHVRWRDIREVRLRAAREVITEDAVGRFADRFLRLLPWFRFVPGLGRMLKRPLTGAVEAVAGAAQRACGRDSNAWVPSEIVHGGALGTRKRLRLGLFAQLVLVLVPEAGHGIAAAVGSDRLVTAQGPVAEDATKARRKLVLGLCVWVPLALFWLVAAYSAGSALFVVLVLCSFALVLLAYRFGLGNLPAPVVYVLGVAPVVTFSMGPHWRWPIGLVILALIWGYEHVLDAVTELRQAAGKRDDVALAGARAKRLMLIGIAFDSYAAGIDIVVLLVALVAVVRLGRLSTSLAFLTFAISLVALVVAGDPALFHGLFGSGAHLPDDIDGILTLETLIGAVWTWSRTAYQSWFTPVGG